jgi:hypothetical protein
MHIQCRYVAFFVFMAVFLLASLLSIAAQNPPSATESADQFLTFVTAREVSEIQRDLESMEQVRTSAMDSERTAQEQRSSIAVNIEKNKQAIAANKDRLKTAKKEKNASQVTVLTSEGKALERDKDLLEKQQTLRDSEINLAKMRGELATLMKQSFDVERQLALKRTEQTETGTTKADLVRAARRLVDLEQATLLAQKKVVDKQGEVDDGVKKVLENKLKTLEAQRNIYGGD